MGNSGGELQWMMEEQGPPGGLRRTCSYGVRRAMGNSENPGFLYRQTGHRGSSHSFLHTSLFLFSLASALFSTLALLKIFFLSHIDFFCAFLPGLHLDND